MSDQNPEIIRSRETNLLPLSAEAAKDFKDALAMDPEAVIAEQINHMRGFNQDLLELLRADANATDEEVITGGTVCYGLFRRMIELKGDEIPDLAVTIETYLASEHEISDPEWYKNKMEKIDHDKQLAKTLEEITKYNPSRRLFYIGALEVKSIFDAYYESQRIKRMAAL